MFPMGERWRRDAELRRHVGAQLARQIGHRLDVRHAAAIEPSENLTGVKSRVSPFGECRFERWTFQLREIGACDHAIMTILACNSFSLIRVQTRNRVQYPDRHNASPSRPSRPHRL